MNLLHKAFFRLSDPLLKKCLWHRQYLSGKATSRIPAWLNKILYCDCAQAMQRYQSTEPGYHDYLLEHSFLSCIEKRQRQRNVKYWQYKPLISIQLPVYQVNIDQLLACLDSVARQLYPHWQLCIVEDGSGVESIKEMLINFKNQYPDKVKLVLREDNQGITSTTQEIFELTDGEYIALLDHDDYLAPEALYEVVKSINQNPELDWIYTDNDKLDIHGQRCCLHAKPAWSPELLMTYNYILHLSVIRRTLIQKAGGFRAGFEGSQDHDLYLRLSELSNKIKHIPRILYSWRQSATSVALNPENKMYAYDAAINALNAALKRRNQKGHAIHPKHSWLGSYQIIRQIDCPEIEVVYLSSNNNHTTIEKSLNQQTNIFISKQSWLDKEPTIVQQLITLISHCDSPYLLFISPTVDFCNNDQLYNLATNLEPAGISLCTGKIINSAGLVDHCGLAYQQGEILYPLRGWDKELDGIGAYGALPRNISLTSPLICMGKTKDLQALVNNLSEYQNISTWLIALSLELQARQQRISVDGSIAILNTDTKPYCITLSEHDKLLLQKDYSDFFNINDPLYHQSMN